MSKGNTKLMRKMNINLLRNIMKEKRIFKKADLAYASGLSVVTINTLLSELIAIGEVLETDNVVTTGGRKAVLYEYNANYKLILAVCLFEQNEQEVAHASVCNLLGETIFEKETSYSCMKLDEFECFIVECIEKYSGISLITIGIPGLENKGRVHVMDYKGLLYEDLSYRLEKKCNLPVIIENDINLAISGYHLDNKEENKIIVGVYYPMNNPPGAGVIVNGVLLKGRNGFIGEVKYLPYGISWENFSFEEKELRQHALKTTIAIGCLYDPDQYVFFGHLFNETFIHEMKQELVNRFPGIEAPNIVFEKNFRHNYIRGAIAVSLQYVNQEY